MVKNSGCAWRDCAMNQIKPKDCSLSESLNRVITYENSEKPYLIDNFK